MTLQVDILTLNTDHRGRVVSVVVSGAGPTASPGLRDTFRTKVSSDWRRHGHVIAVLISDWSRSWWRAQSLGQRRTLPPSSRGWRRRRRGRRGARWGLFLLNQRTFILICPMSRFPTTAVSWPSTGCTSCPWCSSWRSTGPRHPREARPGSSPAHVWQKI